MQKTWVQSLGQKDLLEKGATTHSSILAWKIPWTEGLVGYSPWGCKESDTTEWLNTFTFFFTFLSKLFDFSELQFPCPLELWFIHQPKTTIQKFQDQKVISNGWMCNLNNANSSQDFSKLVMYVSLTWLNNVFR